MWRSLLTAILAFQALLSTAHAGPPTQQQLPPAQAAIQQALDKQISFSVREYPLGKALRDISASCGLDIQVDYRALADLGVTLDAAVTVDLKDVSVRTILDLMLRDIDCTWTISGDAFLVTSGTEAESILFARSYPVGDLLPRQRSGPPDGKALIELITASVAPTSWDELGGPATINFTHARGNASVVVVQTASAHDELAEFLSLLRSTRRGHVPSRRRAQEANVERALERTITLSVHDEPLDQVLRKFESLCGVEIIIDQRALADTDVSGNTAVSLNASAVTARSALQRILEPNDLAWLAYREVLLVTTTTEWSDYDIRAYDVRDLVLESRSLELDYQPLIDLLTSWIEPNSWERISGPGGILGFDAPRTHVLLVSQYSEPHKRIALLLDTLRRIPNDQTHRGRVWGLASPAEIAVEQALERRVALRFDQTPLSATLAGLRKVIGVDVEVDVKALAELKIAPDVALSIACSDVPARLALRQMLDPIGCAAIPKGEIVWITTESEAEGILTMRIHDVGDLLPNVHSGKSAYKPLLDLITSTVEPGSWGGVGGPGQIGSFEVRGVRGLIVSQTYNNHIELEGFMAALRRSRQSTQRGSSCTRALRAPRRAPAPSTSGKQGQNQPGQGGGF